MGSPDKHAGNSETRFRQRPYLKKNKAEGLGEMVLWVKMPAINSDDLVSLQVVLGPASVCTYAHHTHTPHTPDMGTQNK